ncbi:MAG: alpha/beta hydrolase [Lactobacillaceae bacterium]|jgi:uncharacterized alpha/beta hydrolase family protein|nr:alpha/beta hydrolase [Lactobacillaceae bacterium]
MKKNMTLITKNGLLIVLVSLVALIPIYVQVFRDFQVRTGIVHNSELVPTILVPGSSASQNRFNDFVRELDQKQQKHSLVKVIVDTNDNLNITGKIKTGDHHPYIVIAFQNNKDGYSNIKKQSKYLAIALDKLEKKYNFSSINAIGHSNGGLIITRYLEEYYNKKTFGINKLMTIGTPYNFDEKYLKPQTKMLKDMTKAGKKLPSGLTVFSVGGANVDGSDGIVPFASVASGRGIYQGNVAHYTLIMVTGADSDHSALPENMEIIDIIKQFILTR